MKHIFATLAAAPVAIALLAAPLAAAPARADSVGESLSSAGDDFVRDIGQVGRAVRGLFGGAERGPFGEPAAAPTPVDADATRDGAPFNTARDPEVREAAGLAARRISPEATVASIEGVRRPEGPDGPIEMRLRLTNKQVWDAAVRPGPRVRPELVRLIRVE